MEIWSCVRTKKTKAALYVEKESSGTNSIHKGDKLYQKYMEKKYDEHYSNKELDAPCLLKDS